jgi:6-phosphogluconolactonase
MTERSDRRVITASDPVALATIAATRILARIADAADRVAICLTGGSSPQKLYQLLATAAWRNKVPWQRVHWFIGDERFVGPNDPLSNMGMARRIFLDCCARPSNVHPIPTDGGSPEQAASRYELELKSFYGAQSFDSARPLFDVVLMGVGRDGHTASLFPGYPALAETERWVVGARLLPGNAVRGGGF